MTSLFSIFDPKSFFSLPMNWLSSFLILALIPCSFWAAKSQISSTSKMGLIILLKEFKAITGVLSMPGMLFISISLFVFIWLNNFLGLFPYTFTSTSHMTLTLSLAFPLWVGHVFMAWVKTPTSMLAHLVPLGSPLGLSPFMVIIELVSAVIRPVTLSVRLAANMVAGHLLMVLLSTPASSAPAGLSMLILSALILLAILESAVATIQAYVFSILTVLYVNEVNSTSMN